ncbi:Gag protein [Phytophthora palmivora]|uniref:Gag protein n=1 Tax=Phytophthora palmivora TaxID=4796 RepID=A0A2P4YCR4_9STRA|nr:Gag protein [Phytophthora palmivora]
MEEATQIALQEEYNYRQARTPTPVWQGHNASTGAVQGTPITGASTRPVPMELGTAVQSSIRYYGSGNLGHHNTNYIVSQNITRVTVKTVARNSDKFADALHESEGRGQVSVRLADGVVVNAPGVRTDLAVKFFGKAGRWCGG